MDLHSALRLIALRFPCYAQAQCVRPCTPVRYIRLTHSLALGASRYATLLRAVVGFEVAIALDGEGDFAADGGEFS
jgi:hypothetical protein